MKAKPERGMLDPYNYDREVEEKRQDGIDTEAMQGINVSRPKCEIRRVRLRHD